MVKGLLGASLSCRDINWLLVSSLSGQDRMACSLGSPTQLSIHRTGWPRTMCPQRPPLTPSLDGLTVVPPPQLCPVPPGFWRPLLIPFLTGQDSRAHHPVPSTICPPGAPAHPGCRCRGSCGSEAGAWSGGCQGFAAPAAPLRSPSCCSHCCRST